jgi:apolipoprotein N-acyltransferase
MGVFSVIAIFVGFIMLIFSLIRKKRKKASLRVIGISFAVLILSIIMSSFFMTNIKSSTSTDSDKAQTSGDNNKKNLTNQELTAKAISTAKINNAKTRIDGDNLIICYPTEMSLGENSLVAMTFPKEAADILKELQGSKFQDIIIQTTATFSDNKGNESKNLAISVDFNKANLDSINFDNWTYDVSADGTILYSAANGYAINNIILDGTKPKTKTKIGNAGKQADSDWWYDHGLAPLT